MTRGPLPDDAGDWLLPVARAAIASELHVASVPVPQAPAWLLERGTCFVTLTIDGRLRGCIGSLESHRSLLTDVQRNAVAAAFYDPRFRPLEQAEFATVRIEVSVLTPQTPLDYANRADALMRLRPGIDGVVLTLGSQRATFLPQVWEQLADPEQFLAHLARKAGIPEDVINGEWPPELRVDLYQVRAWEEQ